MVGADYNGPAIIQIMQEAPQIFIGCLVSGLCKFDHFAFVIAGGRTILHILNIIMCLQIDIVVVGKDCLYTLGVNHMMNAV